MQSKLSVSEERLEACKQEQLTDDRELTKPINAVPADKCTTYYGLQVPPGILVPEDITIEPHYVDRIEALNVLRKVKPARMKVFSTSEEAEEFYRADPSKTECQRGPSAASPSGSGVTEGLSDSAGLVSETLPYGSVKFLELVKLRQAIERGLLDKIVERVECNPRYLIASGDTPTILQERFRYNGLHSAAIKGQAGAAEVILNYLSDAAFYQRLFPNGSKESLQNRMNFTLDLYLNTPDKGFNETPLHFASKYGHASMVELLVNEPAMDKLRVNNDGKTAMQIVCSRSSTSQNKSKIVELLEGQYYVPLYRSEGDDVIPQVGQPWTPDGAKVQRPLLLDDDVFSSPGVESPVDMLGITNPLRSAHQYRLPHIPHDSVASSGRSSSSSAGNPRLSATSPLVVKAVAGPMSPQQAVEFRRSWTHSGAPNAHRNQTFKPAVDSPVKKLFSDAPRRDPYKGLELIGRSLASEMEVGWSEFWEFLNCSVDIRQAEGLVKLEAYISELEETAGSEWAELSDQCSGDTPNAHRSNSMLANPQTPDVVGQGGEGDTLNTTDEVLSGMFSTLSLHSPTSPSYNSYNNLSTSTIGNGDVKPNTSSHSRYSTNHSVHTSQSQHSTNHSFHTGIPRAALSYVGGISRPLTPRRTLLECIVPAVAPYLDKIRSFWRSSQEGSYRPVSRFSPLSDASSADWMSGDRLSGKGTLGATDDIHTQVARGHAGNTPPIKCGLCDEHSVECKCHTEASQPTRPRPKVFLKGAKPCKVDKDVLKALEGTAICKSSYPAVHSWLENVTGYSTQDQNSWESPIALRHRARLKKMMDRETPKRRLKL